MPFASQVSEPLQFRLSSHAVAMASLPEQLSAVSSQLSLQLGPVSWPGHGEPLCDTHPPAASQTSAPLQKLPSSQVEST